MLFQSLSKSSAVIDGDGLRRMAGVPSWPTEVRLLRSARGDGGWSAADTCSSITSNFRCVSIVNKGDYYVV